MSNKDKEFTAAELAKVTELTSQMSIAEVARSFNIKESTFASMKHRMPELKEAVAEGMKKRPKDYNSKRQKAIKKKRATVEKTTPTVFTYDNEQVALKRFREEFAAKKRKRDLQELKEIDLL